MNDAETMPRAGNGATNENAGEHGASENDNDLVTRRLLLAQGEGHAAGRAAMRLQSAASGVSYDIHIGLGLHLGRDEGVIVLRHRETSPVLYPTAEELAAVSGALLVAAAVAAGGEGETCDE